jgi:hypothetical protein
VPLDVLIPKLTLELAKELANLHDMYMPSKILLKNALGNHKCKTCPDLLAVFKHYNITSNAEYQQAVPLWFRRYRPNSAQTQVVQHDA